MPPSAYSFFVDWIIVPPNRYWKLRLRQHTVSAGYWRAHLGAYFMTVRIGISVRTWKGEQTEGQTGPQSWCEIVRPLPAISWRALLQHPKHIPVSTGSTSRIWLNGHTHSTSSSEWPAEAKPVSRRHVPMRQGVQISLFECAFPIKFAASTIEGLPDEQAYNDGNERPDRQPFVQTFATLLWRHLWNSFLVVILSGILPGDGLRWHSRCFPLTACSIVSRYRFRCRAIGQQG